MSIWTQEWRLRSLLPIKQIFTHASRNQMLITTSIDTNCADCVDILPDCVCEESVFQNLEFVCSNIPLKMRVNHHRLLDFAETDPQAIAIVLFYQTQERHVRKLQIDWHVDVSQY